MKVIMYPALTLDGFIADKNGECYSWVNDEDEALCDDAIKRAGCSLVGNRTYEQYKTEYPSKNGTVTFVYTRSQDKVDTDKVKFVRGTPEEVLGQIKSHGFDEVILAGGGEVNGMFASAGLVDEIIVSLYDVTLGEGIPLFGSSKPNLKLDLISSRQEFSGIVLNHYLVRKTYTK